MKILWNIFDLYLIEKKFYIGKFDKNSCERMWR